MDKLKQAKNIAYMVLYVPFEKKQLFNYSLDFDGSEMQRESPNTSKDYKSDQEAVKMDEVSC